MAFFDDITGGMWALLGMWIVIFIIHQLLHYQIVFNEGKKIRKEVDINREDLKTFVSDEISHQGEVLNTDLAQKMTEWGDGITKGILSLQAEFQDHLARVFEGKLNTEPTMRALKAHGKEMLAMNEQADGAVKLINQAAADPEIQVVMNVVHQLRENGVIKEGDTLDKIANTAESLASIGRFGEVKEALQTLLARAKGGSAGQKDYKTGSGYAPYLVK